MCPHEEKLTAWLLGDLSPEEHLAMTRHLETCASCRSVKDELSRVLKPLRSGLAKDCALRVARPPARATPLRTFSTLWRTPHDGLERVAVLTALFGALFVIIDVAYRKAQRPASTDSGDVTYISFLQSKEEAPPRLVPSEELKSAGSDKSLLDESLRRAEQLPIPSAPVVLPDIPTREHPPSSFNRLLNNDAVREATRKAFVRAPAAAPASAPSLAAPAKAVAAKSERSKAAETQLRRSDASACLIAKPVCLAEVPLACTNASPTNATPPSAKNTP